MLSMIDEKYGQLYKKVKELYDKNINNTEWEDKLLNKVDYRVLYPNEEFMKFQLSVREQINHKLSLELREDISEYLKLRLSELDVELEYLSLGTIGTTLNVMREYYHDILRDLDYHHTIG